MTFWIITVAMAALVALVLSRAIWRGGADDVQSTTEYDLRVYRDQLAEVERDVARGVVSAEDAERLLTEISRRILAVDAAHADQTVVSATPRKVVVTLLVFVLVGGSLALYSKLGQPGYGDMALADRISFAKEMRENRPDQQTAVISLPPGSAGQQVTKEYAALLTRLRETVTKRPGDLQGHRLLAENEANVGNYDAASKAQFEVLKIIGDKATKKDIGDYAELLVLAAGGYVSPEAEAALREVMLRDREDGRARYFIGLMLIQTGRPDQAFRIWDGLLRRGPEDALWIAPIRAQIMPIAQLAGVDYTIPAIGKGAQPGPSAEDIEAASEMTTTDRMEMIGGMVAGLSDRLASEGGPPQDWARLITSLGVLGEAEQARAIFDNAVEVFAGDTTALDMIRAAGSQAGVAE